MKRLASARQSSTRAGTTLPARPARSCAYLSCFCVGRFDVAHRNSRQRHSGRDWRPQPEAVAAILRHGERHDAALVARARANECADAKAWLAARSGDPPEAAPNDPPCFSDAAA